MMKISIIRRTEEALKDQIYIETRDDNLTWQMIKISIIMHGGIPNDYQTNPIESKDLKVAKYGTLNIRGKALTGSKRVYLFLEI